VATAYVFFLITFAANCWIVFRGISKGIEWLCKWAMPVLFVIGIALAVRVLTLGAPNEEHAEWNVASGLGFLWNPDFSQLKQAKVWIAAAGQIFFTLSVGIGVILTYASYLSRRDDVALSGLSAASANELAEVILGGTIVIPAAFVFFGPVEMQRIAGSGPFNLGFVTMPLIFERIPLGAIFGGLWFLLLFLAGVTSSISLAQPAVAFLKDELGITTRKAAAIFVVVTFLLCQPAIFFIGQGVLDELDFWAVNFCLVVFATIETILFGWVFGIDRAWLELHYGADITIPRVYRYIIKYVTPVLLLVMLGVWFYQDWLDVLKMKGVSKENVPYVLGTRILLVLLFIGLAIALKVSWKKRRDIWDRTDLPEDRP
jgi:SNF family Na+-dependent transporter